MSLDDHVRIILETIQIPGSPNLKEVIRREISLARAEERAQLRGEKTVALSEEDAVRYRVISELTTDWVYAMRWSGRALMLEWASDAFELHTGYRPEEINQMGGLQKLMHEEDAEHLFSLSSRLMGGHPCSVEYRLRTHLGNHIWVRDYIRPENDEKGVGWVRTFGAIKDISVEKSAQQTMQQALQELTLQADLEGRRFRALLDEAADGILLIDPDTARIVDTNATACQLLGEDREGLKLRNVLSLYVDPPSSIGDWQSALPDIEGDRGIHDAMFVRADGSTFPAELSLRRRVFLGRSYVIMLIRDNSERRQLQNQLVQNDRLASVGMLAAGVAHEINNPLAYILSNLEYVAHSGEVRDPAILEALTEAKQGAERVKEIVSDLQTFSRPEDFKIGPVDVTQVMESAIKVARNQIRHRASLKRDYEAVPMVRGNARLAQVFLNLLVNASHAVDGNIEKDQITVKIGTQGSHVVVEIADTGSGIAPDRLTKIFDPFYTTKPTGIGTGLGLAICRSITEKLGGSIIVDSQVGKGTTFKIMLQISASGSMKAVSLSPPSSDRHAIARRILVIDDDVQVSRSIARILKSKHEVTIIESPKEALITLKNKEFDVILCDVMMPEMNGLELHRRIRETSQHLASRFVFITGGAFALDAQAELEELSHRCVRKPFTREELLASIDSVG